MVTIMPNSFCLLLRGSYGVKNLLKGLCYFPISYITYMVTKTKDLGLEFELVYDYY